MPGQLSSLLAAPSALSLQLWCSLAMLKSRTAFELISDVHFSHIRACNFTEYRASTGLYQAPTQLQVIIAAGNRQRQQCMARGEVFMSTFTPLVSSLWSGQKS